MSNSHSVEVNRILRVTGEQQASLFTSFVSQLKKFLLIAFVIAVAFWALVLPFFSESIIKTITK